MKLRSLVAWVEDWPFGGFLVDQMPWSRSWFLCLAHTVPAAICPPCPLFRLSTPANSLSPRTDFPPFPGLLLRLTQEEVVTPHLSSSSAPSIPSFERETHCWILSVSDSRLECNFNRDGKSIYTFKNPHTAKIPTLLTHGNRQLPEGWIVGPSVLDLALPPSC